MGYTYWGHDLGGHQISDEALANNPELILRWIQFGVFTPIFRTHATKDGRIERRMWKFENFPSILKVIRLRYTIFPYLYTMARQAYDTGIGLCRPLYYEYPDAEEAYKYEGEYFFGDDILVAPITEPAGDGKITSKNIWLPEGNWWSVSTNELVKGGRELTMDFTAEQIPYFYRQGALIPLNPPTVMSMTERPSQMILDVVAGANGIATLYEDQGDNSDYATEFATTTFRHISARHTEIITIEPRQGNETGLSKGRAWAINLLGCNAPESVKINGFACGPDRWSYDAATRTLTVTLPYAECSRQMTVAIKTAK